MWRSSPDQVPGQDAGPKSLDVFSFSQDTELDGVPADMEESEAGRRISTATGHGACEEQGTRTESSPVNLRQVPDFLV